MRMRIRWTQKQEKEEANMHAEFKRLNMGDAFLQTGMRMCMSRVRDSSSQ